MALLPQAAEAVETKVVEMADPADPAAEAVERGMAERALAVRRFQLAKGTRVRTTPQRVVVAAVQARRGVA